MHNTVTVHVLHGQEYLMHYLSAGGERKGGRERGREGEREREREKRERREREKREREPENETVYTNSLPSHAVHMLK